MAEHSLCLTFVYPPQEWLAPLAQLRPFGERSLVRAASCALASLTGCARRQVLPLVIVVVILSIIGLVLYQVYLSVTKIRQSASERMGKKNVVFTKDGVRVGVKQIQNEKYVDTTQSWVVKAWNLGSSRDEEL